MQTTEIPKQLPFEERAKRLYKKGFIFNIDEIKVKEEVPVKSIIANINHWQEKEPIRKVIGDFRGGRIYLTIPDYSNIIYDFLKK